MRLVRYVLWGLVLVAAAVSAGIFAGRALVNDADMATSAGLSADAQFAGAGGPFTLIDTSGETVTEADFLGKPRAMFFGFTHCPDVCPTTMLDASAWLDALGEDADKLNIIFVSVDPERDNPDDLGAYLDAFDTRIVGLTAPDDATIRTIAERYGISYQKLPFSDGGYTISHTSDTLLFNADGEFVDSIPYTSPAVKAQGNTGEIVEQRAVAKLEALIDPQTPPPRARQRIRIHWDGSTAKAVPGRRNGPSRASRAASGAETMLDRSEIEPEKNANDASAPRPVHGRPGSCAHALERTGGHQARRGDCGWRACRARKPQDRPWHTGGRRRVRFVSRAAHKLAAALDHYGIDPCGMDALDVGASTGGFTEVLLRRGANHVTALDVGRGQLSPAIACDARVTVMEGINARHLVPEDLPVRPGLVVADVSFISLTLVLPPTLAAAADGATVVALVKPQFEVGPEHVGKGGIVRDETAARTAVIRIAGTLEAAGFLPRAPIPSPIEGGDGNREWLIAAQRP